jgi:hypothetical protein
MERRQRLLKAVPFFDGLPFHLDDGPACPTTRRNAGRTHCSHAAPPACY